MSVIFRPARPLLGLAIVLALAGCAASAARPTAVEANVTTKAVGYLDARAVPASLALVPAPPTAGSAGFALDEQVSREARALRGSPRFAQATLDAELGFPEGANQFSCAVDIDVDAVKTPALYRLLERSRIDASAATKVAKNHYQRPRPFMVNGEPTCTPDDEAGLRSNGSYPSGHTSIGWAWALILSEIAPDRADAIQARGRNYGESRLVCNVHWQSDILEGRFMGAAAVARLHDNAAFQRDLLAARSEIAAARKAGLHSSRNCTAEEAVLKVRPQSAL
ncbi:phosphatase PAP2 family protein [Stenotrophomonas maltophilia]|uniref:acid phosphatase n=1 Tax=Stenotrophomonas TaxID=40323 RepID=UPI001877162E|nr:MULTISPECIES: phosphatase PAP2 family protein [Stenotrophomonas]MBE5269094.1 phosphatase PAP2 family protein [Stenotrophomonas sp. B2]MBH1667019.1 phosphatase PAP2 family protein [Stenotrophomonas maltophilia]MCU1092160.1 phosphatase PAP2 family protein [Stenotrophomonas maltophilia]HEL3863944.1 phosphatase PAP2 family protein [Stenotrophomonas maltophilia]HEL4287922.1 phosphatase PAP2 family protein [Stenotrophomonas maltophilia]